MLGNNQIFNPKIKKSLNFSQRVHRQRRISKENLEIMKRLQSKKSFYSFNTDELEQSQARSSKIPKKATLSRFPSIEQPFHLENSLKLSPIAYDIKRSVFTKSIFLENRIFSIEITKGLNQVRVVATDQATEETYTLELKRNDALILMGGVEDWEKLLKCIHIDQDNLALWQDDIYSN